MKGSITVHDRYAYTVKSVEEIPLKLRTIVEVFKDPNTDGTVISYMDFGNVEYIITKETPEEIEALIIKARKEM